MVSTHDTKYGFGIHTDTPYAEALKRTKDALKEQGFGVLTEIDVRQTMKEKRGIEFRPYSILGACNPPLAEQALTIDPDIGLLLPCNVVVYESDGGSVVEVMDPEAVLGLVGNPDVATVAGEVRRRMQAMLDRVAGENVP